DFDMIAGFSQDENATATPTPAVETETEILQYAWAQDYLVMMMSDQLAEDQMRAAVNNLASETQGEAIQGLGASPGMRSILEEVPAADNQFNTFLNVKMLVNSLTTENIDDPTVLANLPSTGLMDFEYFLM